MELVEQDTGPRGVGPGGVPDPPPAPPPRAHGVIKKVPKTQRYRLTASGQLLTAAVFATRRANIKAFLANAAETNAARDNVTE